MIMNQETFNTITNACMFLYYGEDTDDIPHGHQVYDEVMTQLARDFPEMRKIWWKKHGWKFKKGRKVND